MVKQEAWRHEQHGGDIQNMPNAFVEDRCEIHFRKQCLAEHDIHGYDVSIPHVSSQAKVMADTFRKPRTARLTTSPGEVCWAPYTHQPNL